jgi:hypothetical protein
VRDYWNRVTDWLFPQYLVVPHDTALFARGTYEWRHDTAHSGQIPRVDVPLHTTYVIAGPSGNRYIDAHTLSMMEVSRCSTAS